MPRRTVGTTLDARRSPGRPPPVPAHPAEVPPRTRYFRTTRNTWGDLVGDDRPGRTAPHRPSRPGAGARTGAGPGTGTGPGRGPGRGRVPRGGPPTAPGRTDAPADGPPP
ncbi:hypothetical protein KPATCC21470_0047 [Kitasatospora purpeofusca]